MTLDISSFPAYLRSLNIKDPVTTRPRNLLPGPPAILVDLVLRLGLATWFFNTQRPRALLTSFGLDDQTLNAVMARLHSRARWLPVWEELAKPHIDLAEHAAAEGDGQTALNAIRSAFIMLTIGLSGDGLYFYASMDDRWRTYPLRRRLHRLQRKITEARSERVFISHPRGRTWGWLHFPPGLPEDASGVPALVGLHPLGSDKETFDHCLNPFRAAGYATLCVDLPAHGENFQGPRLSHDSEWVGQAALEALATHPDIDSTRLGVVGASLGAYYALRAVAASPLTKACLAFATPFDLGVLGPAMMPGLIELFAWTIGVQTRGELIAQSKQFHLRDVVGSIQCPVCLVHGTQDSVCDFTMTYAIASQLTSPVTVIPLVGVDHEAAYPELPHIATSALDWLQQCL